MDQPAPNVIPVLEFEAAGTRLRIPITGPGGKDRIAVGEQGRRSSVWRIWANPGKYDLYVAVRHLARNVKFSFHESGIWRHAWTDEDVAEKFTGARDRLLDRWERPGEAANGWTRALTIVVPFGHCVPIPGPDRIGAGVDYIPESVQGRSTFITVVVARPGIGVNTQMERTLPVCGFSLVNGEVVLVLATQRELTEQEIADLETYRRNVAAVATPGLLNARAIMLGKSSTTGERFVWDLAAQAPHPDG